MFLRNSFQKILFRNSTHTAKENFSSSYWWKWNPRLLITFGIVANRRSFLRLHITWDSFKTYAKFSEKVAFLSHNMRTISTYQGVRNTTFSDNFGYVLSEWSHWSNLDNRMLELPTSFRKTLAKKYMLQFKVSIPKLMNG